MFRAFVSMLVPCSPPTDAGSPLRKYESSAPLAFSYPSYIRNGFNRLPRTSAFYLRSFLRGHRDRKPSSWDPRKRSRCARDDIRKPYRGNKSTGLTVSWINCYVMKCNEIFVFWPLVKFILFVKTLWSFFFYRMIDFSFLNFLKKDFV